jgi:hypothetical protein
MIAVRNDVRPAIAIGQGLTTPDCNGDAAVVMLKSYRQKLPWREQIVTFSP